MSSGSDISGNVRDDDPTVNPNIPFKNDQDTDDESDCDTQIDKVANKIDSNIDANIEVVNLTLTSKQK